MAKLRLDDMTIEDVKKLYDKMFCDLIDKETLDKIYNEYYIVIYFFN